MTKRLLLATGLMLSSWGLAACDTSDDEDSVVDKQLDAAELDLEEALDLVSDAAPEAIVIEASFESGVDEGYYEILAVDGEDLATFEVDAESPTAIEVARRRATEDELARARAHHHARRRLAAALRGAREGSRDRAIWARLLDREALIDLLDRRGNKRRIRHHLAD